MDYEFNALLEGLFYGLVVPFGCYLIYSFIQKATDKSSDES